MKLENDLLSLNDNKDLQALALFSPTIQYFLAIKNVMKKESSDRKFYAVIDKLDFENIHAQRMYDLDSVDFMFRLFHPKLKVENKRLENFLQKSSISSINSDVVFTSEDYFENSIYFNKIGIRKFAANLAHNFAQDFNKK